MTKSEFIQYLEQPQLLSNDRNNIVHLQEILQKFPYFQSAHLLLTKAFHQTENLNFESQLKKTAAYAADRRKLHALLFIDSKDQEEETAATVDIKKEETEATSKTEEATAPKQTTPIASKVDEPFTESGEKTLDQQILSSALNSTLLQDVSDTIPEDLSSWQEENHLLLAEEESETETTSSFDTQETHSFGEWLHFYNDPHEATISFEEKEEEPSGVSASFSAVPVKQEFYSAAKMARLSVQEDNDLVTETLAKIYADQGNFEKAIKAYQKLQLKYPEKRVYFAGRIKEVQDQLNS